MVQPRLDHDRPLREDADDAHLAPRVRRRINLDDGVEGSVEHDREDDRLAYGRGGAGEVALGVLRAGEGGERQHRGEGAEQREASHATARARRRKKASSART